MSLKKILPLVLLVAAGCSSTSPEDMKMSASLSDLGRSLLQEGKPVEARDMYLAAVGRDAENSRAWNGLGVSNELVGKKGEAREAYNKALGLSSGSMVTANNLAHLELQEGNAEAAIALLSPYADKSDAPAALKENYAAALRLSKAKASPIAMQPAPRAAVRDAGGEKTGAEKVAGRQAMSARRAAAAAATKAAAQAAAKKVPQVAPQNASMTSAPATVDIEVRVMKNYADLGDFPTEAMAQAHIAKLRANEKFPQDATLTVYPEVRKAGGTPSFSVRATGKDSADLCSALKQLEIACVPH